MKWKECMDWKQELSSDRRCKIQRMRDFWSGKEQGGDYERRWGRHIRRWHRKGGMTKESKPLLWTLPWSSRGRPVHVIRTESHAESEWRRGAEEAVKWGLDDERSTEQERGGGWIAGTESRNVWGSLCKMYATQENEWWEGYSSTFFSTGRFLSGFYLHQVSTLILDCLLCINLSVHNCFMVHNSETAGKIIWLAFLVCVVLYDSDGFHDKYQTRRR